MSLPAELENRVLTCAACGTKRFEVGISNGVDGKTFSLWLDCAKCGHHYVYRRITKLLEDAKA